MKRLRSTSPSLQQEANPADDRRGRSWAVVLHATAIFAAAFLIFLVQPMVGKRILPWFGGAPAVWTLCLAFYQTTLCLGYAYAHGVIHFVAPRFQLGLHAAVMLAAGLSLPVLPEPPPTEALLADDPTYSVLSILTRKVALPFLVLASTGPLVQAWFARAHPTLSPYPLYAVSNIGSLLALFVFPFVLEPNLSLSRTGTLWSFGLGATGILVLACAARMTASLPRMPASAAANPIAAAADSSASRVGIARIALWMALSGTAVVLLMGTTNKLCLDVASVPFLWIVPLATYLITFILSFASERFYRRGLLVPAAIASFILTRIVGAEQSILHQIIAYCALLFTTSMVLHGELFRSRPAPRALTTFYLAIAAGGALAGLLVGIVAPVVFDDYHELQIGVLISFLLGAILSARDPRALLGAAGPAVRLGLAVSLAVAAIGTLTWLKLRPSPQQLYKERSFFGVLTVHEAQTSSGLHRWLTSGTTAHGTQQRNERERHLPTSYFGRATGIGLTLTSRAQKDHSRIAVIGLGVGTLAAYGRPGDTMRFYEIDPAVVHIAGEGGYFSYLADSKAKIELVIGDARLSIVDEQQRGILQNFDVIVLDAFSSDAIPIHLVTKEALSHYLDALAFDGLMAVHVSNRHFHLGGLVARIAEELGLHSLQIKTRPAPRLQSNLAEWVVIGRDSDQLARLATRIKRRHRAFGLPRRDLLIRRGSEANLAALPLWTDDYSDLLRVLR